REYWARRFFRRTRARQWRDTLAFYDAHAREPDLAQRYVYVALQMQPERSTSPMAGAYTDQLLMVQMIAALLPPDVRLYVKEHPNQGPKGRERSLYADLLAIPSVQFMPRSFSTFRLL